jgi:adenylyltransferase/sulfurtransferase
MLLSNEEVLRYSRHLIMPEVGVPGQEKLKRSSVLIIGAGGLGSPCSMYLAAAGVGKLGLVDFDVVDFTNLQRQILHSTADVTRSKLDSARETLEGINDQIEIVTHEAPLSSLNALEILADYDLVIDGTDNFPTRYLVNDACVLLGKPNVYGSIFRFDGQVSVFNHEDGPCYRCLYPEPPPPGMVPSCAEGGVLGILPGVIGTLQATEAIKLLVGIGDSLAGRLLLFDALALKFRELKLRKDPNCPVCGENPSVTELIDYEQFCGVVADPEECCTLGPNNVLAAELSERLGTDDEPLLLLDVREPHEAMICQIPGSKLMPLSQLPQLVNQLNSEDEHVVYCHHGIRSMEALRFLRTCGFGKVRNLAGGINAWAVIVDPEMPVY